MQAEPWAKRLCDGEVRVLHSPRADVLGENSSPPRRPELALYPDVSLGGKVLANQRPGKEIPGFIPGKECGFSPRTAYLEFNCPPYIPRVEVEFSERPRFMSFLLVQLMAVLLIPISVLKFARIWVDERAASYASLFSVFAGAVAFLVYSAGQLPTTLSAPLYLLALPYFYDWSRSADGKALIKGVVFTLAAAAVHHVTLIFGSVLFAIPVLWIAVIDRGERSSMAVAIRGIFMAGIAAVGVGIVLLPYWIAIIKHPIEQMPIPHASRSNLLLNITYLTNYFFVPYGMLVLALPFILWYGSAVKRLRPLLLGFWVTFIFGLGGTTPIPRLVFRRAFEILTFERFTLWAVLMALPIVGYIAARLIDQYHRKAAFALGVAALITLTLPMAWISISPFSANADLNVDAVDNFLNRDGHVR